MPRQGGRGKAKNAPAAASTGLSEYERAREANIRRNQAMLASLGLEKPATNDSAATAAGGAATTGAARRPPREPTRRSTRLSGMPAVEYSEDALPSLEWEERESARVEGTAKRQRLGSAAAAPMPDFPSQLSAAAARTDNLPALSSKNLPASIAHMQTAFLGKPIPKLGGQVKRAVMNAAAAPKVPRFNRMSGIQEWKNAVFLFVNIGGSGYNNAFTKDNTCITWYAQPTQTSETAVIRRLVALGRAAADADAAALSNPTATPKAGGLLLFCRLPDEPYVNCGRLALASYDLDARPLRFTWTLLDAPVLSSSSPDFKRILAA